MKKNPTIKEVDLYDFCNLLLQGAQVASFGPSFTKYAEVVDILLKNEKNHLFKVQWPSIDYDEKYPLLWVYEAWYNDSERRVRVRKASEEARAARFILEENVKRAIPAIMKFTGCSREIATGTAYSHLKGGKLFFIKQVLEVKLVESIEELNK